MWNYYTSSHWTNSRKQTVLANGIACYNGTSILLCMLFDKPAFTRTSHEQTKQKGLLH